MFLAVGGGAEPVAGLWEGLFLPVSLRPGWRMVSRVLPEPARAAGSWCRVTSADPGTGSAWQTGGAALDTAAMNSIGTERSWSHLRVIWRAQLWPLRALLVVQESQQS